MLRTFRRRQRLATLPTASGAVDLMARVRAVMLVEQLAYVLRSETLLVPPSLSEEATGTTSSLAGPTVGTT